MGKRCEIDWFRVICDLRKLGKTHHDIKDFTKIPVGTISGFKYGAEPKHADGERLLKMWCIETGAERVDAPKVNSRSYHYY